MVTEADLDVPSFADCVKRRLIVPVDQITPEQARAVEAQSTADEAREEGKAKHAADVARLPDIATKDIEGLDENALAALDVDSLLVSVVERVKSPDLRKPVVDTIKGMSDPKASAIAFLTAKYEEQADFIDEVEKLVKELKERAEAEEATDKADALDTIVRDDE
jgi:hypothetical protein